MQPREQHAILTIALLAAFADGIQDEREREQIKRIADSLTNADGTPQLAQLYQDVLLERVNLEQVSAALSDPAQRQLAYEMAVCVCDSDGAASVAERRFLDDLKRSLGLEAAQTEEVERAAEALATATLTRNSAAADLRTAGFAAAGPVAGVDAAATVPSAAAAPATVQAASTTADQELDKYILNHAIVNGAIELLPQSLATMAIIPLQIKMVYRIGQNYGHELDKGHIKEFIATAGVGLTSQYLEQFGRKLLGGLLGSVAGGLGRGVGSVAAGAAFSFATTYALGHLAKRYYAGGRQMNTALLQSTYQSLLGEARQLQQQNLSLIREKARTLDVGQVISMVRN